MRQVKGTVFQSKRTRLNFKYDYLERFASYWHQVYEALVQEPQSLLEVGPGEYQVHDYLRRRVTSLVSLDVVQPEAPGVVGTVTNVPFRNDAFDLAVAYEVLEHIPFEHLPLALEELGRVARQGVVISLPDNRYYLRVLLNVFSLAHSVQWMVSFPRLLYRRLPPREVVLGGGHLWEIGRGGWPLKRVLRQTPNTLRLVRHCRLWHNPYHHVFVFEKQAQ